MTLLSVSSLTKSFWRGGEHITATQDVSFNIAVGETLALAGPSGSGKSTIARLVMRLLRPDSGQIMMDGQDLLALKGAPLRASRRRFQMVFQDSTAAFNPRATVYDVLDDPLRIHAVVPSGQRPGRIAELLEQVGLSPTLRSRAVHELSGGQRQRLAIARAIAPQPALIVLDEALSAIDSSLRGDVLALLVELQRQSRVAYLFISHDLAMVRTVAHRVAIMDHGRIVESGATEAVIHSPRSEIGKALLAAVPRLPGERRGIWR